MYAALLCARKSRWCSRIYYGRVATQNRDVVCTFTERATVLPSLEKSWVQHILINFFPLVFVCVHAL